MKGEAKLLRQLERAINAEDREEWDTRRNKQERDNTVNLTSTERGVIIAALKNIAQVYDKDAATARPASTRVAEQFERQAKQARDLAQRLEEWWG